MRDGFPTGSLEGVLWTWRDVWAWSGTANVYFIIYISIYPLVVSLGECLKSNMNDGAETNRRHTCVSVCLLIWSYLLLNQPPLERPPSREQATFIT